MERHGQLQHRSGDVLHVVLNKVSGGSEVHPGSWVFDQFWRNRRVIELE